jgi:hypothetical protein
MLMAAEEMIPDFAPLIVDDSGDPNYCDWVCALGYPTLNHLTRQGLGASVRTAWGYALATGAEYVFHVEDDFVFTCPVDLDGMRARLDAHSDLAQLVLRRQPVSGEEQAWGEVRYGHQYSLNPHLVKAEAVRVAMADPRFDGLERSITDALVDAGWRFDVWGETPQVEHIGVNRAEGWRV